MQFNGFYGCTFCEQPGKTVATRQDGHGHVHIFPYIQQSPKGPRRTHQSCLQHAQDATAQHPVSFKYIASLLERASPTIAMQQYVCAACSCSLTSQ